MELIDAILDTTRESFDFGLVAAINILTYVIIKTVDDFNGDKKVDIRIKRLIMIAATILISCIYYYYDWVDVKLILNSAILAPVAWSWIGKPICNKLGIDYKTDGSNDDLKG